MQKLRFSSSKSSSSSSSSRFNNNKRYKNVVVTLSVSQKCAPPNTKDLNCLSFCFSSEEESFGFRLSTSSS